MLKENKNNLKVTSAVAAHPVSLPKGYKN